MRFQISHYTKPSRPDAGAAPLAYSTDELDSLRAAYEQAIAEAHVHGEVHSIIIESLDDDSIEARWVRVADGWRRDDLPPAPRR